MDSFRHLVTIEKNGFPLHVHIAQLGLSYYLITLTITEPSLKLYESASLAHLFGTDFNCAVCIYTVCPGSSDPFYIVKFNLIR